MRVLIWNIPLVPNILEHLWYWTLNRLCYHESCNSIFIALQWRHNGCDSISNHQPHDCFLNCSFRHRSRKTSKLHVTGLCVWNSPEAGEFPAKMASNAENVSIWWRHHGQIHLLQPITCFVMHKWSATESSSLCHVAINSTNLLSSSVAYLATLCKLIRYLYMLGHS